jgi:hypothetical protein
MVKMSNLPCAPRAGYLDAPDRDREGMQGARSEQSRLELYCADEVIKATKEKKRGCEQGNEKRDARRWQMDSSVWFWTREILAYKYQ